MGRLTNYLIHGKKGLFLPTKLLNALAAFKLIRGRSRSKRRRSTRRR